MVSFLYLCVCQKKLKRVAHGDLTAVVVAARAVAAVVVPAVAVAPAVTPDPDLVRDHAAAGADLAVVPEAEVAPEVVVALGADPEVVPEAVDPVAAVVQGVAVAPEAGVALSAAGHAVVVDPGAGVGLVAAVDPEVSAAPHPGAAAVAGGNSF